MPLHNSGEYFACIPALLHQSAFHEGRQKLRCHDGGVMTMVQVQYDGYNKNFKVLHQQAKANLADGEVYTLAFLESESGVDAEWIDFVDGDARKQASKAGEHQ
jgi:hypothetical protein